MIPSAFSTTITTNSTTAGSTKGFLSLSSQSVINSSKGPSLPERMKKHCLHLSSNIHRYEGFDTIFHNFAMIVRMIQIYCVCFMPGCTSFWKSNSSTSFFIYLLAIPLHLCVLPSNSDFHGYFAILLFLFFFISLIFIFSLLLRNPENVSFSNTVIFFLSLYCSVLTPIFSVFVITLFGNLLKSYIFHEIHDTIVIIAIVFSCFSVIMVLISHYLSFYFRRGTAIINFSARFVPWAPYVPLYSHYELVLLFLSFLEELLPVDRNNFQIAFSICVIIAENPLLVVYLIRNPVFQNINDISYLSTMLTVNVISVILMDIHLLTKELTPILVFVVSIISFVLFLILYKWIIRRTIVKYTKSLYSVYKLTSPVLPPTTPLVFTTPMSNQVPLSHEAYSVMQAFSSLEISTTRELYNYIFIGAYAQMPAIKNIDFIKWGLNYFSDTKTLIICAQICQYFEDSGQTQTVLLQKLSEHTDLSGILLPIIHNLELDHTDVISDKPLFLKLLQKKAHGGLTRSRRALALFWGCVLKHSENSMNESLCRLRDSVYEANLHFEELMRCYPLSKEAIGLYLGFITEIQGEYLKCNQYINDMSAKFIEMKSNAIEADDSIDTISLLLQDQTRSYSPYTSKLSQYMEQERQSHENTSGPLIAIWTLAIVSSVVLIVCILIIMIETLISFYTYPDLLSIVHKADDVIMELASLIIGSRRICLFSSGALKNNTLDFGAGDHDTSMYDIPEVLIPWMLQKGEQLPNLLIEFYKIASMESDILKKITTTSLPLTMFGFETNGTLNFLMDMMCMAIRNIAVNIPSGFSNSISQTSRNQQSLKSLYFEKMSRSFTDGRLNSYLSLINNHKIVLMDELNKNLLKNPVTVNSENQYEGIENFTSICNSSELYLLMQNIEQIADLTISFIDYFVKVSKQKIDNLALLLYYSMILFPIGYIVVFGLALLFVCIYIYNESIFRLTLFLSLPEQVASEIFRARGNRIAANPKKNNFLRNQQNSEFPTQTQNTTELMNPEVEKIKEKALTIESLYQFSLSKNFITGTGLKEFAIFSIIYIIAAALLILALTTYSRSVNTTFYARTLMHCYSTLRYSSTVYSSMFIEEGFFSDDLSMFNKSEILRLSKKFLNQAKNIHRILTYGNDSIDFTFREYESIENQFLKRVLVTPPDPFTIIPSSSMMQSNGYKSDSIDSFMRVFLEASTAIIETFEQNPDDYQLNDETWQQYNHLILGHLLINLENATYYYLEGMSSVINHSFIVALLVSLFAIIILLLIFIGPILSASISLSRYFYVALHVLCKVPPDVFNRSIYINKWLKGQISRSNYSQFENTFKRTVSPEIQSKLIEESPEKLIVFTSAGEFIDTHSFDTSSIEEKTLVNILNLAIEADPKVFEDTQYAVERFQEAKDRIDNIVIMAKSNDNVPVKLTITGITSADLSSSISSVQRYYSYIAISIRDAAEEMNEEKLFQEEKKKTLDLLKQVVPSQFANRIHDGENRISFSSGIGSVISILIDNYEQCLENLDLNLIPEILVNIRKAVDQTLSEFDNVSLINLSGGEILFIAGLFNDEQNGRTEAIDSLQFSVKLNRLFTEIFESYNLMLTLKFGICTGGPIYCKLIMDGMPINIVSGDSVSMSKIVRDLCQPKQLLLERTTFECSYGLNITPQQVGEFEFQGKHTTYYSLTLDQSTIVETE